MLEKNDLKQIKEIVQGSEQRLDKKITSLDNKLSNKIQTLDKKVNSLDNNFTILDTKIDSVKDEIITTINREISDLADINRAVITKTDELDYRLRIVERKLGLNTH